MKYEFSRNAWSVVSGTGNPNMKLVLVYHPGTESCRVRLQKHRNLVTLRSGAGSEFIFELPAKLRVLVHIHSEIKVIFLTSPLMNVCRLGMNVSELKLMFIYKFQH